MKLLTLKNIDMKENYQFLNVDLEGREVVVVVRKYPRSAYAMRIDFTDYDHKDIWATIPAVRNNDGSIVSIKTGKPVQVGKNDEVRPENWGTAFNYPNGDRLILTRFWEKGKPHYKLVERTCRDCECFVVRAKGEELTAAPRR